MAPDYSRGMAALALIVSMLVITTFLASLI